MANNKKTLSIDLKINGDKQLKETVNDLTALDKAIITAKFPTNPVPWDLQSQGY